MDDIVISGISGRLPESDNLDEFWDHLINKDNLVTEDNRRWETGLFGLPRGNGKMKDLSRFDATFFGVHAKQANTMDPQLRMLLEVSYEAILDAGVDPQSLRGTNAGVYIGCSGSEATQAFGNDPETLVGYSITGTNRTMLANRLSYILDFKGPSYAVDTACSSSFMALHLAIQDIRQGNCDAAIVGGVSMLLKPQTSLQFLRLGVLSPDGLSKSFDSSGNGYCRSEAIVAVLITKKSLCKRAYCDLVNSGTNTDGYKEQGITFPSGPTQTTLVRKLFQEAGIKPSEVEYFEAHGTGTKVGDPEEVNGIASMFCQDRTPEDPLLIGSVKSNMGHSEASSGLAALAKVVMMINKGVIPPNLHFNTPNPDISALIDGRMKVVTEPTEYRGGYIGVNSFGFGGSNVHIIVKPSKLKSEATTASRPSKVPRLVTCSGRTEEAVVTQIKRAEEHVGNQELLTLVDGIANASTQNMLYRGYAIFGDENKRVEEVIKVSGAEKRPLWYIFTGMGSQWPGMGRDLMVVDIFHDSIERSHQTIKAIDPEVDIYRLLTNGHLEKHSTTLNNFVGIASIQVALVDCLRAIGLQPDGIVGHSVGELGCAYADGSLTAEETVLAAYWRGRCVRDSKLPEGAMAAVGLTWEEAKQRCPKGTLPACHNTEDTVTISGEVEPITKFVNVLKEEGIFARMVDSSGVAFHSPFMAQIAPILKNALEKVITNPKPRTSRWVSTSIPESNWGSDLSNFSSAAYHVNNLVSPVLFNEGLNKIPSNAVTIEIGPHCLLQAMIKRSLSTSCEFISLMNRKKPDNLEYFLSNIGKLYLSGVLVQVSKLYPEVNLPVSRSTPSIAPAIRWDHAQEWDVPTAKSFLSMGSGSATVTSYTIDASPDGPDHFVLGHRIDGRILYPATGYLCLAWRALARMHNTSLDQLPVEFKDVAIHQATIMPKEGTVTLEVRLAPASNTFEIAQGDQLTVSGKIFVPEEPLSVEDQIDHPTKNGDEGAVELSTKDAYKELRLRGYEYGGLFQGIVKAKNDGSEGILSWQGNWVSFIDTMLQISILQKTGRALQLPTRIRRIAINPAIHPVLSEEQANIDIPVTVNETTSTCRAGGIQIQGMHATVAPRHHGHTTPPTIEQYSFVPYSESNLLVDDEVLLKYRDVCAGYLEQTLGAVRERFTQAGLDIPSVPLVGLCGTKTGVKVPAETLEQYLTKSECGYLQLIHGINKLETSNDFGVKVEQLKDDSAESLANDMLLKALLKGPHLKQCLDIIWENISSPKIKIIEVGSATSKMYARVIPLLNSQPTTQLDYTATDVNEGRLTEASGKLETMGAKVAEWNIASGSANGLGNADLIVADNLKTQTSDIHIALQNIVSSLKDGGFLLIHDVTLATTSTGSSLHANNSNNKSIASETTQQQCINFLTEVEWAQAFDKVDLEVVSQKSDGVLSSLFLCRKRSPSLKPRFISVGDRSFKWVEEIKTVLEEDEANPSDERIWLVADRDQYSGVVGFVNCLKQEPGGDRIRCIFNAGLDGSSALPDMSSGSDTMEHLKTRDLIMNVYRDGQWGSFRHSFLNMNPEKSLVHTTHAFANVLTRGDLSTLSWIASPLTYLNPKTLSTDQTLCTVYYASLNFRDIMLATGKLPPDALPADLAQQDNILGLEFSGRNQDGRRIMGLVHSNSLATSVKAFKHLLFDVPDDWSLEDAATVPVVYSTAYYALVVRGQLRGGETVLIHSGSGGVGQAAIAIALSYGCRVFTTVGTPEKRAFLKQKFSQLTDDCFANSRDLTFEPQILKSTNGKGVDIVLNSLAAEKLEASLRVLAVHGRFLEIGKYDLSQNTGLGMALFLKNTSFHGVHLDRLMDADNPDWPTVAKLLCDGIASGVVTPLNTTVFEREKVEMAFRFMAQGKHIGKVLIKVREEEKSLVTIPTERKVLAVARNACHPGRVYIITGGLGGFGLELANWLVDRGAKKLVLTSRSGVKTGYQANCVARWQSQGVEVMISKRDVSKEDEAKKLIEEALNKGPVGGIFNLAMVLKDGFFDNQTAGLFQEVCAPKRDGTLYLDSATRLLCGPELEWFVMFSSVSCGRGNPGQTNYGFANSTMERVCEKRRYDGLAGVAIQWGVIGDVGVAMETMGSHDVVVSGCIAQRMSSCLTVLDGFLSQPNAVVSSFVAAEKAMSSPQGSKADLVESVAHILGVSDVSSLSPDATLGDLGLDSLMGVEVKQTLERDYSITMNMREIRQLTMRKLGGLSSADEGTSTPGQDQNQKSSSEDGALFAIPLANVSMVIPHDNTDVLVKLNSATAGNPVYFIHPIEGTITPFEALASKISTPCYALQCSNPVPTDTIPNMASYYLKTILATKPSGPIKLVGYSFGACVAFEMALQLQKSGQTSIRAEPLILIDGSPDFVTIQTTQYINELAKRKNQDGNEVGPDVASEVGALCAFIEQLVTVSNVQELIQDLSLCKTHNERISLAITKIQQSRTDHSVQDLTYSATSLVLRIKASYGYQVESQLKCDVSFLQASQVSSVMKANKLEQDYGLQKLCNGTLTKTAIKGDHTTILKDDGLQTVADIINGL